MKIQNSKFEIQNSETDYHCHILPFLDDGSASLAESLKMARELASAGFKEVYCTPHCMKGVYDTTPADVRQGVAELQKELDWEGISLKLHPGMEYYLDEYFPARLEDPVPLGQTGMLLVEAPSQAPSDLVRDNLFRVLRKGYTPLFAHPERYDFLAPAQSSGGMPFFQKIKGMFSGSEQQNSTRGTEYSKFKIQNSTLDSLRELGCLFQGNLGSFAGMYGPEVKRRAEILKAGGHYHCYGTDAHNSRFLRGQFKIPEVKADNLG